MISVDVFHVNVDELATHASHLLPGMMFSPMEEEVKSVIEMGLYVKTATLLSLPMDKSRGF